MEVHIPLETTILGGQRFPQEEIDETVVRKPILGEAFISIDDIQSKAIQKLGEVDEAYLGYLEGIKKNASIPLTHRQNLAIVEARLKGSDRNRRAVISKEDEGLLRKSDSECEKWKRFFANQEEIRMRETEMEEQVQMAQKMRAQKVAKRAAKDLEVYRRKYIPQVLYTNRNIFLTKLNVLPDTNEAGFRDEYLEREQEWASLAREEDMKIQENIAWQRNPDSLRQRFNELERRVQEAEERARRANERADAEHALNQQLREKIEYQQALLDAIAQNPSLAIPPERLSDSALRSHLGRFAENIFGGLVGATTTEGVALGALSLFPGLGPMAYEAGSLTGSALWLTAEAASVYSRLNATRPRLARFVRNATIGSLVTSIANTALVAMDYSGIAHVFNRPEVIPETVSKAPDLVPSVSKIPSETLHPATLHQVLGKESIWNIVKNTHQLTDNHEIARKVTETILSNIDTLITDTSKYHNIESLNALREIKSISGLTIDQIMGDENLLELAMKAGKMIHPGEQLIIK